MCDSCGWEDVLEKIQECLDECHGEHWAEDTLLGIQEWVQQNEHATDRRVETVENIHRKTMEG